MRFFLFYLACFGVLTSSVFLGMVFYAAIRFRLRASRPKIRVADENLPPVSLLKPLHGAEPNLREYIDSFFHLDYPVYEILFCARREDDAGMVIAREVAAQYSHVAVRFLASGQPPWPNARCYSLSVMAKVAQHEILVITDSDVRVQPEFLKEVVSPLAVDAEVGGVTCVYRGMAKGLGLWGLMEGLGMSVEMTAGVTVAEMMEGMKFMLGPAMVVRTEALKRIGGFDNLGYYYADDFMLGNLVSNFYKVVLSTHTIDHCIVNNSFMKNFRHQWNWMKSTRFSRPLGHLGTVLTFAMPFGLLGLLGAYVAGLPWCAGISLFAWAYLSRVLLCLAAGGMVVQDSDAYKFCWLYPLRDLLGFVLWVASYTSRYVGWRDDLFVLEKQGKMRKVNA